MRAIAGTVGSRLVNGPGMPLLTKDQALRCITNDGDWAAKELSSLECTMRDLDAKAALKKIDLQKGYAVVMACG